MKIAEWLIRILFWLQAFAGIMITIALVAIVVYAKPQNKLVSIVLLSLGFLAGVFVAEFIRRRYRP